MEENIMREKQPFPALSRSLIVYLYVGHFLTRWGTRMWEFSVGLYMIHIWPKSLLFAAIYGVVESASAALFGPIIGRWVDRLTYVQVLRLWLLTQNLSFIIAGGATVALIFHSSLKSISFVAFISLFVLTTVSGAIGVLSTLAGTILIEREWVVIISEGQPPEVRTKMNAVIRRIDLICKLFAPVISGFIISFISLKASAVTLALWNTVSVWLQFWLLMSVYNGIPSLSERSQKRITRPRPNDPLEDPSISQKGNSKDDEESSGAEQKGNSKLVNRILPMQCIEAWIVYLKQDIVLPGVALALLYFTVLSFGRLMTAALKWMGMPAYVIGIARGVSATIGIAATVVYPVLQSHISTLQTGLWSIWTQWIFLLVCVASIWVPNARISAWMLMGGVAASRLGLWMFDLSVIQQMQDHVPESDRCVVGGVQNSLQSMLDLLSYVMGIIISNPQDAKLLRSDTGLALPMLGRLTLRDITIIFSCKIFGRIDAIFRQTSKSLTVPHGRTHAHRDSAWTGTALPTLKGGLACGPVSSMTLHHARPLPKLETHHIGAQSPLRHTIASHYGRPPLAHKWRLPWIGQSQPSASTMRLEINPKPVEAAISTSSTSWGAVPRHFQSGSSRIQIRPG
uniref:Solute carrier family 40 member n=1 Tax=Nelumbo nucifera TaxID=4432 RepID=A0A822Z7D4_NELNU|nr:TPA_asm: hypothetical protein HUJ06_013688 [Nelumbo nucifera]